MFPARCGSMRVSGAGDGNAPFIGVTTYGRGPHNRFTLPAEYVDAVRRAGGIPLLLPPGEARLDAVLLLLKAVVLTGGGDLDPDLYGGKHHETIYMVEPERDRSEIELARRVFDLGVPTLAICRGSQLLNVCEGGSLIEHLPDVVGEEVSHRAPPRGAHRAPRAGVAGIAAGGHPGHYRLLVHVLAPPGDSPRGARIRGRGPRPRRHHRGPGDAVAPLARGGAVASRADGGGRPRAAAPVRRAGGGHGRALSAGTDFGARSLRPSHRLGTEPHPRPPGRYRPPLPLGEGWGEGATEQAAR